MDQPDNTTQASNDAFNLGEWHVEPSLRTVSCSTKQISVEPRVMRLLIYLVAAKGRVVSRGELLDEVWDDVVVNEEAVSRAVSELRKVLDDDIKEPRYVQTLRKSGYRLLVPSSLSHQAGIEQAQSTGSMPEKVRLAVMVVTLAGLAALAIVLWPADEDHLASVQAPLSAKLLTSYPGREIDPAIDGTGERVVFAWNGGSEGKEYDLYVRRIGMDGEPVRLTKTLGFEGHATWAPDGNSVAFVRSVADRVAVWQVSWNGDQERKLFDLNRWSFGLDWFPDGRSLVVSQTREDGVHRLVRVFLDAASTQDLTFPDSSQTGDNKPAVSPDGNWVAFVRGDHLHNQDVYVVNIRDGEERRLSKPGGEIRGVDWSPDGRSIVYSTDRGDGFGLWRIDINSGEAGWLPLKDRDIFNPVLASNGRLVYESISYQENLWGLDLVDDPQGVHANRLNVQSTMQESHPAHSPDGMWLAFISNRTGQRSLQLTGVDQPNRRALTHSDQPVAASPVWSPDGAQIAISLVVKGNPRPHLIDVGTGRTRPLLITEVNAIPVAWSRDGQRVYLSAERDGQWNIWAAEIASSKLTQVTINGGVFAAEDQTGEQLYYTTAGSSKLYQLPLANTTSNQKDGWLIGDLGVGYRLPWRSMGGTIYSIVTADDQFRIARFNPSTRSMEIISSPPGLHFSSNFSVSPDGRRLIYSRLEDSESDLKVLDL